MHVDTEKAQANKGKPGSGAFFVGNFLILIGLSILAVMTHAGSVYLSIGMVLCLWGGINLVAYGATGAFLFIGRDEK